METKGKYTRTHSHQIVVVLDIRKENKSLKIVVLSIKKIKLECGPMANVMAALPNIGGAFWAGNRGITEENMEGSQHTDFNEDKTNESASVACSHVRL